MKRLALLVALFIVALTGAAFAASPADVARELQGTLFTAQGKLQWNSIHSAFSRMLSAVDVAAASDDLANPTILFPQTWDSVLDADTAVATFRMAAVRGKNAPSALLDLTAQTARMKTRLEAVERLIAGVADAERKADLYKSYAALTSGIMHLWLANMDFDPDSLNGPGLPPMGDGEFLVSFSWYEGDNQNFKTYLDAQDRVKELIQQIARAF